MKKEKEVEFKVNQLYHEQDIQTISDTNQFEKVDYSLFPKTNKYKLQNSIQLLIYKSCFLMLLTHIFILSVIKRGALQTNCIQNWGYQSYFLLLLAFFMTFFSTSVFVKKVLPEWPPEGPLATQQQSDVHICNYLPQYIQ